MGRKSRSNFAYLDTGGYPIAFAHRGGRAAGASVENTMLAFKSALQLDYTHLETDVISSADGKVVAIHGSKNSKDEAKSGLPLRKVLETLDYEEIRRKHKIGGEEIPLLGDIFDEFPDVRVNIDPKTEAVVKPLGHLLKDRGLADRVGIGSFSYARTKGVADILGGQDKVCTALGPLGFIAVKARLLVPGYLVASEAACLQLPYNYVGKRTVEVAHDAGLDMHVWTVNDQPDMYSALENGVDGIMTDNVVALRAVMHSRGEWPGQWPKVS